MSARKRGGPLAGIRVLAIAKVWAGPYATKLLSQLGAEVIKVESITALDEMRAYGGVDIEHAPYFLSQNTEVLSVRVNLKSDEGVAHLKRMIEHVDIVLDNLRPGALAKLGLSYEQMKAIKLDIIHVSIKMYGTDGPLGYQTGYAPSFAAIGGLTYLVGHEGRVPRGMNIRYGDTSAGAAAALGAIAALHHRERTGDGQLVDLSAVEAISSLVGDSLFTYALTGEVPVHQGNFHPELSLHGAYPTCDEGWISIACDGDAQWQVLAEALGDASLRNDTRFASHDLRVANRQALEDAVATLTAGQDGAELAEQLRSRGVAAYASASSIDLVSSDLFWANGTYRMVECGNGDLRPVVGSSWRIEPDGAELVRGAPMLGEHDDYVYGDILGLSPEEIERLKQSGAIS